MFKAVEWFIDRLVQRVIPIIGTLFTASIESLHALSQAEQQSRLEDAARRYEADGKPEIAAALRRRAGDLTSENPAAQALRIYENVVGDEQPLLPPTRDCSGTDVARLPDFQGKPAKPRRKRPVSPDPSAPGDN